MASCIVLLLQMGAGFEEFVSESRCEYSADTEENKRLGKSVHQKCADTQIQSRLIEFINLSFSSSM